jgi:hypothetical protein
MCYRLQFPIAPRRFQTAAARTRETQAAAAIDDVWCRSDEDDLSKESTRLT